MKKILIKLSMCLMLTFMIDLSISNGVGQILARHPMLRRKKEEGEEKTSWWFLVTFMVLERMILGVTYIMNV